MSILLKFYAAALVIMLGLVVAPLLHSGKLPGYFARMGRVDMLVWILYQWMATAVADEILFHGLFQTLLLKYWREKIMIRSFEFPVVILFTSVAFAAGRTNVPVYGGHARGIHSCAADGIVRGNRLLPHAEPAHSDAFTGLFLRISFRHSLRLHGSFFEIDFLRKRGRSFYG